VPCTLTAPASERGQSAEAEPDRRVPVRHSRRAGEHGQRGAAAPHEEVGIVAQPGDPGHDPLPVAGHPVAVQVGGEDDRAQRGVPAGLAARVRIEAGTAVQQQDPGVRAGPPGRAAEHAGAGRVAVAVGHGLFVDIGTLEVHGREASGRFVYYITKCEFAEAPIGLDPVGRPVQMAFCASATGASGGRGGRR
jgi:hypothetical protein